MYESAKKIINLLNKEQKKNSIFFLILLLISTFFEGLSVALVFPLIKIVSDKNYLFEIYESLGFLNLNIISNDKAVFFAVILIITAYTVKSLYLIFFSWWKSNFVLKINNYISNKLFKKYIFSPYSYFFSKNSSELIRNIYSESRYINQAIDAYFKLLIECFSVLIILIVLLLIQTKSTLTILIVFIPIFFFLNNFFSKNIKNWGYKKQFFVAKIIQNLQQSFSSIKEILLRGNQNFFIRQFDQIIYNLNDQTKKLMFISEIPKNLLEILTILLICAIIYLNFNEINDFNQLAPIVGLFSAAALRVVPAFNRIIANKQNIDSCYASVKLVFDELKKDDFSSKIEIINFFKDDIKEYNFIKEIELRNIEYRYPISEKSVFKNLNLKIKKNQCICLVGESGCGKTTIADIISGLLNPIEGKIILDGKEVNLYNHKWRKLIGYVTQSVFLIDDTIKNNILFGLDNNADFDQKKFEIAIKYSQLGDFIKQIPEGLDYRVGENGVKLSGGQRQRIGIARTLYLNPEILILDEITSSLDKNTSVELLNSLNKLHGKITIIYISHNDLVIKNADLVYKIKKDNENQINLIESYKKI